MNFGNRCWLIDLLRYTGVVLSDLNTMWSGKLESDSAIWDSQSSTVPELSFAPRGASVRTNDYVVSAGRLRRRCFTSPVLLADGTVRYILFPIMIFRYWNIRFHAKCVKKSRNVPILESPEVVKKSIRLDVSLFPLPFGSYVPPPPMIPDVMRGHFDIYLCQL